MEIGRLSCYLGCNFPMKPLVRLLVGRSISELVGQSSVSLSKVTPLLLLKEHLFFDRLVSH